MPPVPDRRLEGRNGAIWRDYIAGHNQEWCADKYGLSQQRVSDIVREVQAAMDEGKSKDDWRKQCLEAALEVHAVLMARVRAEPPPAFHAGEVLHDDNGEIVRDYTSQTTAAVQLAKYNERISRLLGLDAPVAIEQAGDLKVTIEGVNLEDLT